MTRTRGSRGGVRPSPALRRARKSRSWKGEAREETAEEPGCGSEEGSGGRGNCRGVEATAEEGEDCQEACQGLVPV